MATENQLLKLENNKKQFKIIDYLVQKGLGEWMLLTS